MTHLVGLKSVYMWQGRREGGFQGFQETPSENVSDSREH